MTKKSFANSVASEMNDLMTSDDFRSMFSRPQVKSASVKNAQEVIEMPNMDIVEKAPANSHVQFVPETKIEADPSTVVFPEETIHAHPPDVAHTDDCMPADDMDDDADSMVMASNVALCIKTIVAFSEKMDSLGFDKTASLSLITLETLISEAAKKKDKKDKKDKGDKKFPFFMKGKGKGKDKDEDDKDDKKDDKKSKKDDGKKDKGSSKK